MLTPEQKIIEVYKNTKSIFRTIKYLDNTFIYHFVGRPEEAEINFVLFPNENEKELPMGKWENVKKMYTKRKAERKKLYNSIMAITEDELLELKKMASLSNPMSKILDTIINAQGNIAGWSYYSAFNILKL